MPLRAWKAVVLGGVFLTLGCSGGGGAADGGSPGTGGTGGGGGTGGAGAIDPTPFLGSWTETATFTFTDACANLVEPATFTGPITVTAGSSSALIRTDDSCSIPLNVTSASQATLARATQCSIPPVSGLSGGTVAFSAWTLAISGNTGTETASGTFSVQAIVCPVSVSATLAR
jgi:hypothetical protein